MAKPLVYCPSCGAVFESGGYSISGFPEVVLSGNIETCININCRQPARVADGLFDATADALKVIQGPSLTHAIYAQFASLIEEAQQKRMEPEEFVKRAEAIHPDVGAAAKKLARSKVVWAAALALMLAALNSCNFELKAELDVNQLIEQILQRDTKTDKK